MIPKSKRRPEASSAKQFSAPAKNNGANLPEGNIACLKCEANIDGSSFFCPNCGITILANILNKTNTTAEYDPTSRVLKPWREQVILPPRLPSQAFRNSNSWKPIMRNTKPGRPLRPRPRYATNRDKPLVAGVKIGEEQIGVLSFHGMKFKKVGYDLTRAERLAQRKALAESLPPPEIVTENIEQRFYPLGVYNFAFIANMTVYVHVSLQEIVKFPSTSTSEESLINMRWVRIGYTVENENSADDENMKQTSSSDLIPLAFLPNQIARCLLMLNESYVDLSVISPKEYYMANFLQKTYANLLKRITLIPKRSLAQRCDQWCYLHSSAEETSSSRSKPRLIAGRREFVVNSEHPVSMNSEYIPSPSAGPLPLMLNCVLTQVTVKLRLGDFFNDVSISTIIRLEVEYLPPESVSNVFIVPLDSTTLPYPDHIDTQPIYLTKLHFYVIPLYYKYDIKPKRISFTKRALSILLETTEEHIEFALSTNLVDMNRFCRIVASTFRLECTTAGVKIFINGVDETIAYKIVNDPDALFRSTFMLRFHMHRYVIKRREKSEAAKARYLLAWESAKILQRFIRILLAKQRVLVIKLNKMLSDLAGKTKGNRASLEKVSELVNAKLNLKMNISVAFRGIEVIVYGKFFPYFDTWNLFLHVEEVLDTEELADIRLPLNYQIVVDDGYLRHVVDSIQEIDGSKDSFEEIIKTPETRSLIFNSIPKFIDVMISKQKTRMAVKLIKYFVF